MKNLILIFFILFSLSKSEVVTNTTSKTIEAQGEGLSRAEAINNALIEALSQINGVYIKQEKFISNTSIETSNDYNSAYIYNNKIQRLTKGKIDSYKILEIDEFEGKYEARISVTKTKTTKEYKTPGINPKNRRSIVLIPTSNYLDKYLIKNEYISSKDINNNLSNQLTNDITKTRKFTVLDRKENQAYLSEKSFILSNDSDKDEVLKLGKSLGADYLLITKIVDFKISKNNNENLIAVKNSKNVVTSITDYKIIAMASRQIKWSDTLNISFEIVGNDSNQIIVNSLNKISENITTLLLENIYPTKVIDIKDNIVTLNQGSIKVGSKYNVYSLGDKLYDSYTKESLGRNEIFSGTIEIIRSQAKMSYAKIIDGNIKKDSICRIITSSNSSKFEGGNKGNTTLTESGGVILPFD